MRCSLIITLLAAIRTIAGLRYATSAALCLLVLIITLAAVANADDVTVNGHGVVGVKDGTYNDDFTIATPPSGKSGDNYTLLGGGSLTFQDEEAGNNTVANTPFNPSLGDIKGSNGAGGVLTFKTTGTEIADIIEVNSIGGGDDTTALTEVNFNSGTVVLSDDVRATTVNINGGNHGLINVIAKTVNVNGGWVLTCDITAAEVTVSKGVLLVGDGTHSGSITLSSPHIEIKEEGVLYLGTDGNPNGPDKSCIELSKGYTITLEHGTLGTVNNITTIAVLFNRASMSSDGTITANSAGTTITAGAANGILIFKGTATQTGKLGVANGGTFNIDTESTYNLAKTATLAVEGNLGFTDSSSTLASDGKNVITGNGAGGGFAGTTDSTITATKTGWLDFKGVIQYTGKIAVLADTRIDTGIDKDGGKWTSNFTSADVANDKILFGKNSVWVITTAGTGYTGGPIYGDIGVTDVAATNAALARGSQFFSFRYTDVGTTGAYINGTRGNISEAIAMTPVLVSPMRMYSGVKNHFADPAPLAPSVSAGLYRSNPAITLGATNVNVWGNYVGRTNEFATTSAIAFGNKMNVATNGGQLGIDVLDETKVRYGVMFGYESILAKLNDDRNTVNDYYVGFYGQRFFEDEFDIRGLFGIGFQQYDSRRFHGGWNVAKYGGHSFEATLELGRRFCFTREFSLRPITALDLHTVSIDRYQETGPNELMFTGQSLTQSFLRVGSDAVFTDSMYELDGGVYYKYNFAEHGDNTRVTYTDGVETGVMTGSGLGRSYFTANGGATVFLDKKRHFGVFGNYSCDVYTDRDARPVAHNILFGGSGKW